MPLYSYSQTAKRAEMKVETNKSGFEIEVCSRCCGVGKYSFNQVHGDKCFKCGGVGKCYTKRGKLAKAFFDASAKVELQSLKVGDVVQVDTMASPTTLVKIFVEVTEVREPKVSGYATINGVEVPVTSMGFSWTHEKFGKGGFNSAPTAPIRKALNAEEKAQKLAEAIAYQSSLTATGKPKRKGA
jgi:Zn-finger nucleic acid-binding protein